ncbi:NAD(P)-binding protein [Lentinus tigrinus ALCF2SS1-7]|uniref:NAD(P)-binding protein n=1 Tax=Lentinus tigrinus ALCF2SS1-6 TaxID=1328759 RepID=A0A5C2RN91_9APHY|nr:NAD(P)-binding protein [Lentinus tigrinus ALCF2SS1-6]RPD68284.1 NAD(P)-binding protein [Lentinus tigrinus ALCF2SS1-7]
MSLLVLSARDTFEVTTRFGPDELVDLMAGVFSQLSSSDPGIVQPHRTTISTQNHTALFMPSRIASSGTTMKVVSVPTAGAPEDVKARGLPASTIVMDEHSGHVRAIVNARLLTALRNAAGSLLSARLLLRSEPTSIVAIGAGAQVQAHVSLFLTAYPSIRTCTVFNRSQNARLQSLCDRIGSRFPAVQISTGILSPAESPILRERIGQASIIVTATSSKEPLFPSEYVRAGTHLCLIGSYTPQMHEIDTGLVKRAGKVVVDQKSACLTEAGELITAGSRESDLVEIGQLLDVKHPSWTPRADVVQDVRQSGDLTIFKSVGVGVQDVAIACAVVDRAVKDGIGRQIEDYDEEL